MGSGIAQHLLEDGFTVYGYNRTEAVTLDHVQYGLKPTKSLQELVESLPTPRVIWLMLTAGKPTDDTIFGENGLVKYLQPGDILIDGGNSFYEDTIKRASKLAKLGIKLIDVGTSGGPSGARNGACLMVGGTKAEYNYIQPILKAIAAPNAIQFFEGPGAGHFVKMVHNGIEYGMMQAIAEGFNLMKVSSFKPDLKKVVDIYSNQSVIESRLITWLGNAFQTHGVELKDVTGTVAHTGEGAWTVEAAKKLHADVKIIEESLQFRKDSTNNPSYTGQLLSAIREQFGGHSVK
jgi:6-phosphogluconate dehydrogenase